MKIKYECEADENGYEERLIVDGEVKYQSKHERTNFGTKKISGDDLDELCDDIIERVADDMPTFLGMNLCKTAEDFS